MTTSSIAYNKLLEDVRSHQAQEDIARQNLSEVKRHNLATEGVSLGTLEISSATQSEQARHNRQQEANDLTRAAMDAESRLAAARISAGASGYSADRAYESAGNVAAINTGASLQMNAERLRQEYQMNSERLESQEFIAGMRAETDQEIARHRDTTSLSGDLIKAGASIVGGLMK